MSAPSSIPSAAQLSKKCYGTYEETTGESPPAECTDRLDCLTKFIFFDRNLQEGFLREMVDWEMLTGEPNGAHSSIADFACCSASAATVTTNYDDLIELAARLLRARAFLPARTPADANQPPPPSPLVKLHGCITDRLFTVWCKEQLDASANDDINTVVRRRVTEWAGWLRANLAGHVFLIAGFWTDWAYLSEVLRDCLKGLKPSSVFILDPKTPAELQATASDLWEWTQQHRATHIPEKAEPFLLELRRQYSRNFITAALKQGEGEFTLLKPGAQADHSLPDIPIDDLYQIRRDLSGSIKSVNARWPDVSVVPTARTHLILRNQGFQIDGPFYSGGHNGKQTTVRVIATGASLMSTIKRNYGAEPPQPKPIDYVICVGAREDGGAPGDLVRSDTKPTIVRRGSNAMWLSDTTARELGLLSA